MGYNEIIYIKSQILWKTYSKTNAHKDTKNKSDRIELMSQNRPLKKKTYHENNPDLRFGYEEKRVASPGMLV